MNVLLITLQKDLEVIGLKLLHYYLLEHGVQSRMLFLPRFDASDARGLENIRRLTAEVSPGLIGVSLMSHEFYAARDLTAHLKAHFPSVPVVWGGIHATAAPEMSLDHADFACVGEGEKALLDLVRDLEAGGDGRGVRNLCYRRDGEVVRNELHELIEDLDQVPPFEHLPRHSYIQDGGQVAPLDKRRFRKYARHGGMAYFILGSRGCPFHCTYCCNNLYLRLYKTKRVRRRSVEPLMRDIERALRDHPDIEHVNFNDDCFLAAAPEYLDEFCRQYRKRVGKPFIIRTIPTFVTPRNLPALKEAGLRWIGLGLQTGSDRVCKEVFKRNSFREDFLNAARIIHDCGVAAVYDAILDNPFETEQDTLETVRTLMETPKPFVAQIFGLNFFLGSELYDRARKECPERTDASLTKDYFIFRKSRVNELVRLAAFLSEKRLRGMFDRYTRNPDSRLLKVQMFLAKVFVLAVLEPLTYFRVTRIAEDGSYVRAGRMLSKLFRVGFGRYVNHLSHRRRSARPLA